MERTTDPDERTFEDFYRLNPAGSLRRQLMEAYASVADVTDYTLRRTPFSIVFTSLCARAFLDRWGEHEGRTRALRRAADLMNGPSCSISPHEPEVP